jgi:hypothetical protein
MVSYLMDVLRPPTRSCWFVCSFLRACPSSLLLNLGSNNKRRSCFFSFHFLVTDSPRLVLSEGYSRRFGLENIVSSSITYSPHRLPGFRYIACKNMRSSLFLSATAALASRAAALPTGDENKPYNKAVPTDEAEARAAAVKEVFQTAWDGYYQ